MIATTIKRIRARFTRSVDIAELQSCNCLANVGELHVSDCPLASAANLEANVERQTCELYLVTDCEIFTRTVKLHDGRQSCPTCALIVPDLVADLQSSGLTNNDLRRAGAVIGVDDKVWGVDNTPPNGRYELMADMYPPDMREVRLRPERPNVKRLELEDLL